MARSTSGITISMTCSTISTVTPVSRTLRTSSTPVLRLDRRQPGQHFVEQQQFRLGRQRARDLEPALFGRDQIAGQHVGARAEAAKFQHLVRLAAGIAHHGGADQRADDDVVDDRHGLEALDDLEGAADAALAALGRRQRGDVLAVEDDRALGRRQHAGDQVEQRRLAGAVRADQADDFAAPDRDRDVAVGDQAAEALPDAAGFEQWRVVIGPPPCAWRENRPTSPCGRASEISDDQRRRRRSGRRRGRSRRRRTASVR